MKKLSKADLLELDQRMKENNEVLVLIDDSGYHWDFYGVYDSAVNLVNNYQPTEHAIKHPNYGLCYWLGILQLYCIDKDGIWGYSIHRVEIVKIGGR